MPTAHKQLIMSELSQASHLEQTYFNLTRNGLLWENNLDWFLRCICKTVAEALEVERVGVYSLEEDNSILRQQTVYTASTQQHTNGLILKKRNYPKYFQALFNSHRIVANNAHKNKSTKEFSKSYLSPFDIRSKFDCSLYKAGKVIGVFSTEHTGCKRKWSKDTKEFLSLVSDLIAQRFLYEDLKKAGKPAAPETQEINSIDDTILRSSPYSIISITKNGLIKSNNAATKKLLGYDEDELISKDFCAMLLSAPGHEEILSSSTDEVPTILDFKSLKKKIVRGKTEKCECFLRHRDGQAIPVSLSLREHKNNTNKITGYLCTAFDISQQVSTRQALVEEEERYRFVFEGSNDAILLMQNDFITDCNLASLSIFGCSKSELIGKSIHAFSPTLQADGDISTKKLFKKITTAISGESQVFEWQHQRGDESLFDTEVTLNKVEVSGQPYVMASIRDISHRKESERELQESRQIILKQNESLALLNDLSNQLHAIDSLEEIYTKTFEALGHLPNAPRVLIYTVDEEACELHLKLPLAKNDADADKFSVIPFNPNFNLVPLNTGVPLYCPDVATDIRIMPLVREGILDLGYRSLIEIPLVYQEKRMAIVSLAYKETSCLQLDDIEALHSIGKTVSLALANTISRSELQYIAHHDSLTGLTNRAYFHKQFELKIDNGKYDNTALYLLDLDRFKEINDTLGHFIGDKILQQMGPRLKEVIKDHEFLVSRLGGDEFVIMAYGVSKKSKAKAIAKKIINCLHEPFVIDDLNLVIDTSVGIALYPKDGDNSHALLRSADVAMYQAKHIGGGYSFYNQEVDVHTPERLAMLAEMGSSIKSGQLSLHYQPKVNLKTNEVTGFEALARWDHPRLGILEPTMFVPLIEMSNSVTSFTEEILNQALSQQMKWRINGLDYPVAVNISARNLMDDRIVTILAELLEHYNTPHNMLELEITETALMHDSCHATEYLNQIAKLGVQISIDDFGTGYSSLAYLQNLPINKLKLDRKFVVGMTENPQSKNIVETIITLSRSLGLEVIAEGVENADTLEQLKVMNCDQGQGFYICRPNTWDKILLWLQREIII